MTQTGMVYRSDFDANIADRFDSNGKFHSQTRRSPARAGGNMATSVNDLARFATALLNGKIIRPETMQMMLTPVLPICSEHEFPIAINETDTVESAAAGLAYGVGWGLLTHTKFGPAFFKEGHGDGAQNYIICFQRSRSCMVLLTNDDNGELAFRPLLEHILGDTVTPWEWEGYTRSYIETSRKNQ
jgi:CubicO group peptidase (beta-lactamase class C family)